MKINTKAESHKDMSLYRKFRSDLPRTRNTFRVLILDHLEMFILIFSNCLIVISVSLLNSCSSFLLYFHLWCFSILLNYCFQFSLNETKVQVRDQNNSTLCDRAPHVNLFQVYLHALIKLYALSLSWSRYFLITDKQAC